jgi:hypothetical protein
MRGISYDTSGEGSSSTYWRRRFIVLAIGLVVFGLAAWGISSALAVKAESASRAGRASDSAQSAGKMPESATSSRNSHGSGGGRSGAGGSGGGRSGTGGGRQGAGGRQAASGRQGAGGSPTGSGTAGDGGKAGSGQAAGHGTILPAFCGLRDIVLSVFAGQTQFGPKDSPTFELSIVSTQPAECTFNIGSAHLVLMIKEGPNRVWSSADCPTGTASLDAALARGVPTVVTVTWHRKTSTPGCSGQTMPVPSRAYTAYAVDGTLTSQPVAIRLT